MFWSCGFSGLGKLENPENGRFVGMAHGNMTVSLLKILWISLASLPNFQFRNRYSCVYF